MEKVKAFVIKYQLWFKLAAIALLVCTIFTPYTCIILPVVNEVHMFSIFYYLTLLTDKILPVYAALFSFSVCICIATALIIVLLVFSILKKTNKPFLFITLITFGVLFFCYLLSLFFSIYAWGSYTYNAPTIPHIAFYLLLILSVFVAFVSHYFYKDCRAKHSHKSTTKTKQKIAELEKRIEELENRKDGK